MVCAAIYDLFFQFHNTFSSKNVTRDRQTFARCDCRHKTERLLNYTNTFTLELRVTSHTSVNAHTQTLLSCHGQWEGRTDLLDRQDEALKYLAWLSWSSVWLSGRHRICLPVKFAGKSGSDVNIYASHPTVPRRCVTGNRTFRCIPTFSVHL